MRYSNSYYPFQLTGSNFVAVFIVRWESGTFVEKEPLSIFASLRLYRSVDNLCRKAIGRLW